MSRASILLTAVLAGAAVIGGCATDGGGPTAPSAASVAVDPSLGEAEAVEEFFGMPAPEVSALGAVVFEDFVCGLGPAGATTNSQAVVTPSGNVNLVCRGSTPDGPPETLVLDDVVCGTPGGVTTESHFVWTKSGQATLTCHFRP